MKKTLQKIITIALIGVCLTSSLFAEKGRDFKNTGKPHIEHKMMPGLMKFEELKGVVKVEEKDNAKKIYVYTSANKRVLVETVRKFDYEKKPYKNFDDSKEGLSGFASLFSDSMIHLYISVAAQGVQDVVGFVYTDGRQFGEIRAVLVARMVVHTSRIEVFFQCRGTFFMVHWSIAHGGA